jgi:hypothetical protein
MVRLFLAVAGEGVSDFVDGVFDLGLCLVGAPFVLQAPIAAQASGGLFDAAFAFVHVLVSHRVGSLSSG